MKSDLIIFLAVAILLGLPFMLGPMITRREMERSGRLLTQLLEEADRQNISNAPEIKQLSACFINFLAYAPLLGSGEFPAGGDKNAKVSEVNLEQFLTTHGWAARYLMSLYLSFSIVLFVGRPWSLKRILPALCAWIIFRFLGNKDGTVKIVYEPASYERAMRNMPMVDPKSVKMPHIVPRAA